MIKNFTLLLFLFASITLNAQNINIPDANFKKALVDNAEINIDGDAEISQSEAAAFTGILNVSYLDIIDLTGIECFTEIIDLSCADNDLTTLNISKNTKLETLFCSSNELVTLDVSNNTQLTSLTCGYTAITSLDLRNNVNLTDLSCYQNNNLTDLDVSNNTLLTSIRCSGSSLVKLNVSNNPKLKTLECYRNNLSELDISNNPLLTDLKCFTNKFPFSQLYKIKKHYGDFDYESYKSIFTQIFELYGYTIDYSAEAYINGNETTFTWHDSKDNVIGDEFIKKVSPGVYQFLISGFFKCKMINETFPGLELTTNQIIIRKHEQNITIEAYPEKIKVGNTLEINATASSNLKVSYKLVSGDATVIENKITPNKEGVIEIKAIQTGNNEFKSTEMVISFTVEKKEQNIFFHSLNNIAKVKDIIELNVSSSSGLSVSLSIVSGDAKLDGNKLTVNSEGKVIIKASQSGNFEFLEAETTKEIVVEKRSQTFNSVDIPTSAKVNDILTLNATASSNLPVSFEIISGEATLKENQLTCTKAGTVKIKTIQIGNDEFEAIETTGEIVVSKKSQTISFTSPPASTKVNDVLSLNANASSTLPVSFEIVSGEANLNGNQLTCTKSGILKVKAKQIGNDEYEAAEATIEIAVSKKDQFITFNDVPSEVEATDQLDMDVTISSGLEVSYTIVKGNASISGNTITFNELGNVIIKAINAGNDEYNEAEQSYLFIVRKKEQEINADNIPSQVTINEKLDLNLSASSGLAIDLEIISGTAVLSGTNLNFTEAGEVKVKASQAGNSVYESTETSFVINVVKKNQTLDIQNTSGSVLVNETLELTATASSSLPVNFSITSGDADLIENTITFTSAGVVTVKVKQNGNEEYISAEETVEFTVNKNTQTVNFVNAPTTAKVNDAIVLTATASSNLEVSFEILEGEANLNSNELTCLKSGIVKVKATQAGNDEFETAEAVIEITVEKRDQTIDFTNTPTTVKAKDEIELNATASSGLEVTFELVSGDASINGKTIICNKEGIVEIKATQAGNDEYKPTEATIEITVDIPTGINDVLKSSIQIYPNPVVTDLNIKFEKSEDRMIYIYDVKGQIQHQQESFSNLEQLNISNFKSGMYILKIQSESGTVNYKILKQ